jgi:SAM-dependent methyltransferase
VVLVVGDTAVPGTAVDDLGSPIAMTHPPCRFCGTPLQHVFTDLGMSPVANDNVPMRDAAAMEPFFPLCALVCSECFLVQLAPYETPKPIFREDYAYFSSYSSSWLEHSRRYTERMIARLGLDASSQVIELASNDGYLLQYFKQAGIPVLGIEPTANTAQVALDKGIPTRVEFWGEETARAVAAETKADLLLGNNVLAHVPDLNDFVAGMKIALKDGGTITMEFPHLLNLIELNQWDTIYHEHFSYLSFATAERVFEAHGLRLFDVQQIPTHGGSLRIFGCHEDDERPRSDAAGELLERERAAGLDDLQTYLDYGTRVVADKRQILTFLIDLKAAGNSIAGYGAAAKGNTLLNYCGVGRDFLDFTCDANPHKQGHVLPGTHIPILPPDAIAQRRPDVVLILPWNIKDEVMAQLSYIREWGGRFAARSPELRLFG